MPATPSWLAAIEAVLNRSIAQSLRAESAANRLNGTSLEIEIRGLMSIRAGVHGGRLALMRADASTPDAALSGSALALLDLFRGRPGAERAEVRGDADVAARYREFLELARPDWEDELSRLIGDVPARRLSIAARSAFSWLQKAAGTAAVNLGEYLREESRDVVSGPELEEFLADVDALRETADRVEARLARLEHRFRDPA
jgi:ubiquinone biosynthesis accessory factor UbiJ